MERRKISIPLNQLEPFQKALGDFLGDDQFSLSVKTKPNEVLIPTVIHHPELGEVVIEKISLKPGKNKERYFRENYPFFYFLYNQLENQEREKLLDYFDTGGLVMFRRTRPSKEFKEALDDHCEEFHGGFTLVTFLLESLERLNSMSKDHFQQKETLSKAEEESLENLYRLSSPTIHFYPLIQGEKKYKEVREIPDKLNKLSDNYEFPYHIILTIAEIERGQALISSFFALAGLLYGPLGEKISSHFGNFYSMIAAHGISEAFTMLMGAADRIKKRPTKQEKPTTSQEDQLIKFFGLSGLVYHRLPPQVQKWLAKNIERFDRLTEAINRALILSATIAIIIGGSQWAAKTENIIPFLLIAPINTSLVLASEIALRWKKAKKIDRAVAEKIADTFSSEYLQKIAEKYPYLVLAIQDFIHNQPALGAWLGSLSSTPAIILLKNLFPQLPEEQLYGLSALFFEGGGAMLGKLFSETARDPWKAFLKIIKDMDKKR